MSRWLLLVFSVVLLSACGQSAPLSIPAPKFSPGTRISPVPTLATLAPKHSVVTPFPTATTELATAIPLATQSQTLPTIPPTMVPATATSRLPNFSNPSLTVLAQNLPGPDDLVLAPDGSIYISDITTGTIMQLTSDGKVKTVVSGLDVPEGMVFLPDGSLVIAEQGKNRLVRFIPQTGNLEPFLQLKNETGQDGVDGLGLGTSSQGTETIVIPDSPNGIIWSASLDGKTKTEVASAFVRPTGVWAEPDGSLLVVDENGGALTRLHPDGKREILARLSIPDDVIEDASGNIYVVTLGDHAVHVLSGQNYSDRVLTSDLSQPQGITFAPDGNLVVTDPGQHRLVKILIYP